MTPLDYYLWGAVKNKSYADKPEPIDALKDKLHTIDNVLKNSTNRVGYYTTSQPFELNYFPLLTGRIVLSNKKINLGKYSIVFLSIFQKKVFGGPYIYNMESSNINLTLKVYLYSNYIRAE